MKSTYEKVKDLEVYLPLLPKKGLKVIGKRDQNSLMLILTYKNKDSEGGRVFNCLGSAYLALGDKNSALDQYKILKDLNKFLAHKLFNLIYK